MKKLFLACCLVCFAPLGVCESWVEFDPPLPTSTGDKIEVLEFFWYGCGHCYAFEPRLVKWHEKVPDDVVLVRVPAASSKSWLPHARAYYAAVTLGVAAAHHQTLFDAIHKDKRDIFDAKQLEKFFVRRGVDAKEYRRAHASEEVDEMTKRAYLLARDYKIRGVPSLVVNGRYLTAPRLVGDEGDLIDVLEQLVERERAAMHASE